MKTVVVLCLAAAFLADVSTKKDKKEPIWWEKFHDVEEKLEALHSIVHGLQQQIEDCCNKTGNPYCYIQTLVVSRAFGSNRSLA